MASASGHHARAVRYFQRAVVLAPDRPDYVAHWADALASAGRPDDALDVASRALGLKPETGDGWSLLGSVYERCHAHQQALYAFSQAVVTAPGEALYRLRHAETLWRQGALTAALTALQAAVNIQEDFWPAHLMLSQLEPPEAARTHSAWLEQLRRRRGADPHAATYLHMAMGHAFERSGNADAAFGHYAHAKGHIRPLDPESGERMRRIVDGLIRRFPHAGDPEVGFESFEPIFVVGLPGTGVGLIERMLVSHPCVRALNEDHRFATTFQAMSHLVYPSNLDTGTANQAFKHWWHRLGERYVLSTRPSAQEKLFFVDAWPHNLLYLGFIARALPQAKIIVVRRHPLDACWGSYASLQPMDSEFSDYSLSLTAAAHHVAQMHRLMEHWRAVLRGRLHEIDYDAAVENPGSVAMQLFRYCDLPDAEKPTHFQSSTLSEPINIAATFASSISGSVNRWRLFASQLEPVRAWLEGQGVPCPM